MSPRRATPKAKAKGGCNVPPRTMFCHDNLPVLRRINSQSIDLIYLDPPFNKGRNFHAPIGTTAEGADFADIWTPDSVKDEWHNEINDRHPALYKYLDSVGDIGSRSAKYYLIYMAVRLLEMHRILKDAGSIYLHCDSTANHYLRMLMDTIFGHRHFRNDISWCYTSPGRAQKQFPRKHDTILFYAKSESSYFNGDAVRVPYAPSFTMGGGGSLTKGKKGGDHKTGIAEALRRGKIVEDYWCDVPSLSVSKERVGYPTQKPLALLERIIKASSQENDLVLDPFCGCATTCVAAERLKRDWIGIDVSKKAFDLVKMRIGREVPPDLFNPKPPAFREDIPARTDIAHKKRPAPKDKQLLFGQQDGRCNACKTRFDMRHLEIDHIIPQAQGGSHEIENLQLLCGSCNRLKGDRPMEYLQNRLRQLFA